MAFDVSCMTSGGDNSNCYTSPRNARLRLVGIASRGGQ